MKTIDAKTALRGFLLILVLVPASIFLTTVTARDAGAHNPGYPAVGSRVYYFTQDAKGNVVARPAIVIKAHLSESGPGQAVDLQVWEEPDDSDFFIGPYRGHVSRSPGQHLVGYWDWMEPTSTGE